MYQVANTYTFKFADGETLRFGPDPTVDDWCGLVTDVVYSTDVSSNVTNRARESGAYVGAHYGGALVAVFDIMVVSADPAERAAALNAIRGLKRAMTEAVTITWTEADGIKRNISAVLTDDLPIKSTSGPQKTTQLHFTAGHPFIESDNLLSLSIDSGDNGEALNAGNGIAYPLIRLHGPFTACTVYNTATGELMSVHRIVTAGHYVEICTRPGNRYVKYDGAVNCYSDIHALSSTFFGIGPRETTLSVTSTGGSEATHAWLQWRSAWR